MSVLAKMLDCGRRPHVSRRRRDRDRAAIPERAGRYYAASGWNLNNIALWPGSLLRRHDAPLPGVNTPWLYLGMLFGTFPWHNEDNYFESINYHHAGAPKQWYGVPGAEAAAFEDVVRRFYKQRLLEVPDLLHRINLQVSPAKLIALGVPVKRLTQRAGEFVVTFPQAFHGGFSYGFNCGEAVGRAALATSFGVSFKRTPLETPRASIRKDGPLSALGRGRRAQVNFATRHWIAHARLANERYRRAGRLAVVSHDRLMFTLKANEDDLDAPNPRGRRASRDAKIGGSSGRSRGEGRRGGATWI